jgi:hypothetical protein
MVFGAVVAQSKTLQKFCQLLITHRPDAVGVGKYSLLPRIARAATVVFVTFICIFFAVVATMRPNWSVTIFTRVHNHSPFGGTCFLQYSVSYLSQSSFQI